MVNATDGQIVEVSQMSDEHIAGIFRMPPAFIQNYRNATFSNAEQQDMVYLKYTITPVLRMIEQELNNKMFTEANKSVENPLYTNFNIKGFLRGDMNTQMEFYKFLRNYGVASANTILEMEDLPKLEGDQGDMILVQGAMIPLDQLREFYEGKSGVDNLDNKQRAIGYELIKEGDELPLNKKK
jgi:phage portal protein BeeE